MGKATNTIRKSSRLAAAVPLYTPEEKQRRDNTRWTLVQGILAPVQFVVFAVSLLLVFKALATGTGYFAAHASIVLKTLILYTIMITGSIWEKVVFGKYLFAKSFFWEDVVSILVLALHTAYLYALFLDILPPNSLLILALAAYAAYVVNAAQFLLKLRQARLLDSPENRVSFSAKTSDFSLTEGSNSPQLHQKGASI